MFSSWGDRMDREFDNMMSKPRKYVNSVPPLYNPRRIAERATMPKQYDSEEQRNKLAPRSRYPLDSQLWDRSHQFVDDFWDKFSSGRYFIGFDESLHTREKEDKYLVTYNDPGLKQEDVKVDFDEKENELVIHIDHEDQTDTSASAKTYQSTMKFDKSINVDDIKAEIDDNGILLVLPKTHADNEHMHHITVKPKSTSY